MNLESQNIRVGVRIRPLSSREILERRKTVIHADEASSSIVSSQSQLQEARSFSFDHAFGPQSNSDDISTCVKRALDSCFEGYNASLLAYGQTGSGKTFTVQQMTASLASFLFQGVKDRIEQGKIECIVSASYIELYNEELRDLLIPAPPSQAAEFVLSSSQQGPFTSSSITIREHPNGEIFLEGASEIVVESEEQLLLLIGVGDAARSTAATALNERSSRSHSVLIINLTQQLPPDPETGELVIITGKLSIVDLAGSERTKKSKSEGSRMKEAVNINGGLSALGNVISALSENKKGAFIPYRDSKLTRLLQDSIGGNSMTTLIACVSPAEDSLDESLNTLKYAARAKNIKNQQRQNAISSGLTVEQRAFALLKQIVENVPVSQGLSMTLRELLEAARWSHEACVSVVQRLKQVLKCEQNVASDKSVNPSEIHSSEVVRLTQEVARLRADKDGLESRSRSIQHAVGNGLSVMSQLVADGQMSLESKEAVLAAIGSVSASSSHYLLSSQSSPGVSRSRLSSYPLDFSSGSKTKIEDGTLTDTQVMEAPPTDSDVQKISDEAAALRVRVVELEAELTSCTAELRQAKEDLDKDELIFASKMAEMAEMQKLIEARQEESASPSNPHPENEAEMDNQSWTKTHRHRYTDVSRSVGIPLDGEADDTVLFGEETEDGDDAGGEGNAAAEAAGRLVGALEEEVSAGRNRAMLEQEVAREREAHEAEKAAMMDRAAKMEAEIKEREALIERLQDSESRARATSDLYKHQLQEAQQELDLKVAEVEELQTELHSLLSDRVRTTEEKAALVSQCEERIAEANARLSALRKKLKEQEALIRASVETEGFGPAASRVERLRAELTKMKSQQDSLKKELMAKAAVGEKQAQARARELSALKKAVEDARKQAKKLEEETRAQREVIRRKEAQLEIDRRKIKELMSSSASKSVSSTPKAPPSTFGSVKKDQGVLPKGLPPKPPSAWGASPSAAAAAAKTSAFNNSARVRAMSYASSTVKQTPGGLSRARLHPLPFPSSLPRPSHGLGPSVKEAGGSTSSATLIESLLQSARDRKRAEIEMEEANQSLEALITQSLRVDQERSKLSQQMKGNGYDEKEVQLLDRLESLARQLKDKVDEFESIAELKREVREKAASIETDIRRRLQERPLSQHEATEALMRVVDVIGTTGVARQRISFSSSTPTHSQPPPPPPPVNNAAAASIPPVIQPLGKLALISHSLNLNSSVDVGSSTDLPLPFPTKPTPQTPTTVSISKVLDFGVALPSVDLAMNAADEALSRADQTSRSRRGSLSGRFKA